MRRYSALILFMVLAARSAVAQVQPLEGQVVRGVDGVVLGIVERVVNDAKGHPAQVLVKAKGARAGGPHSLSVLSLNPDKQGLEAPISKAEFDAMPVIELEPVGA